MVWRGADHLCLLIRGLYLCMCTEIPWGVLSNLQLWIYEIRPCDLGPRYIVLGSLRGILMHISIKNHWFWPFSMYILGLSLSITEIHLRIQYFGQLSFLPISCTSLSPFIKNACTAAFWHLTDIILNSSMKNFYWIYFKDIEDISHSSFVKRPLWEVPLYLNSRNNYIFLESLFHFCHIGPVNYSNDCMFFCYFCYLVKILRTKFWPTLVTLIHYFENIFITFTPSKHV